MSKKRDCRIEQKARKESVRRGYEYRPGAAKATDEARRLERGFRMLRSYYQ